MPEPSCDCHFFGIYRGTVAETDDPEGRSRLRVTIPQVFGTAKSGWALPCTDTDHPTPPALGAPVWVMFEAGDPNYPVWMGTWILGGT